MIRIIINEEKIDLVYINIRYIFINNNEEKKRHDLIVVFTTTFNFYYYCRSRIKIIIGRKSN